MTQTLYDDPEEYVDDVHALLTAFGLTDQQIRESANKLTGQSIEYTRDALVTYLTENNTVEFENLPSDSLSPNTAVKTLLSESPRGITSDLKYWNDMPMHDLNDVFSEVGHSVTFLNKNGEEFEALFGTDDDVEFQIVLTDEDNNYAARTLFGYPDTELGVNNYPALIRSVNKYLLPHVRYSFIMLENTGKWRFYLVDSSRLEKLRERFGHHLEFFNEPLIPCDQPCDYESAPVPDTANITHLDSEDLSDDDLGAALLGGGGGVDLDEWFEEADKNTHDTSGEVDEERGEDVLDVSELETKTPSDTEQSVTSDDGLAEVEELLTESELIDFSSGDTATSDDSESDEGVEDSDVWSEEPDESPLLDMESVNQTEEEITPTTDPVGIDGGESDESGSDKDSDGSIDSRGDSDTDVSQVDSDEVMMNVLSEDNNSSGEYGAGVDDRAGAQSDANGDNVDETSETAGTGFVGWLKGLLSL